MTKEDLALVPVEELARAITERMPAIIAWVDLKAIHDLPPGEITWGIQVGGPIPLKGALLDILHESLQQERDSYLQAGREQS